MSLYRSYCENLPISLRACELIALKNRSAEQGIAHHSAVPARIYTEHPIMADRIVRTVRVAQEALASVGRDRRVVYELGCGTGDISGQLAWACNVVGYDCHPGAILKANERWGKYKPAYLEQSIESVEPSSGDLLILCEILEHIYDPVALVKKWLPHFKTVVISHPIDGDLKGDISGGDHAWSYSVDDFCRWFELGGHEIQTPELFEIGQYKVALAWGRNICQE
jgi:SAM-dependent methyltransferase